MCQQKALAIFSLQSFNTLHMMYHEATACHVTGDLVELLSIFLSVLKSTRPYLQRKGLIITLQMSQTPVFYLDYCLWLRTSHTVGDMIIKSCSVGT